LSSHAVTDAAPAAATPICRRNHAAWRRIAPNTTTHDQIQPGLAKLQAPQAAAQQARRQMPLLSQYSEAAGGIGRQARRHTGATVQYVRAMQRYREAIVHTARSRPPVLHHQASGSSQHATPTYHHRCQPKTEYRMPGRERAASELFQPGTGRPTAVPPSVRERRHHDNATHRALLPPLLPRAAASAADFCATLPRVTFSIFAAAERRYGYSQVLPARRKFDHRRSSAAQNHTSK